MWRRRRTTWTRLTWRRSRKDGSKWAPNSAKGSGPGWGWSRRLSRPGSCSASCGKPDDVVLLRPLERTDDGGAREPETAGAGDPAAGAAGGDAGFPGAPGAEAGSDSRPGDGAAET